MAPRYISGEEIRAGDLITYGGQSGIVEFVVTEKSGEPSMDWYIDEFGGGIMIRAVRYGNVFIGDSENTEDLEFVSRRKGEAR
jgi:hypothetical protein